MSKDERKYFRISEVAQRLNVNPSLLRFWETQFEELKPMKTKGGERLYREEHIQLIKRIYDLTKVKGYTLAGAKELLQFSKDKLEFQNEITQRLKKLRSFLEDLKNSLP